MMSLLRELDSFTLPFLQICQSYGLRRLRALRATKNSNAHRPNRPSQNDFGTAFVPTGQPEMSQTQGVRELAHGHPPSKPKSVLNPACASPNPNGIASFSPGLIRAGRARSYPGLIVRNIFQP